MFSRMQQKSSHTAVDRLSAFCEKRLNQYYERFFNIFPSIPVTIDEDYFTNLNCPIYAMRSVRPSQTSVDLVF